MVCVRLNEPPDGRIRAQGVCAMREIHPVRRHGPN